MAKPLVVGLALAIIVGTAYAGGHSLKIQSTDASVVGFAQPHGGGTFVLRSDGTVWQLTNNAAGDPIWTNDVFPRGIPLTCPHFLYQPL